MFKGGTNNLCEANAILCSRYQSFRETRPVRWPQTDYALNIVRSLELRFSLSSPLSLSLTLFGLYSRFTLAAFALRPDVEVDAHLIFSELFAFLKGTLRVFFS